MITFKTGNIFDSQMQYITIPVNCGGVAGAGLAEQCKKLYPLEMEVYFIECKRASLKPGHSIFGYPSPNEKCFIFFPTKDKWYNDSKIEYINEGLLSLVKFFQPYSCKTSIAFPALGCGFGLLKWEDVKPIMIEYLSKLDIPIEIYEPCPEREMNDRKYLKKTSKYSPENKL